MIRFACPGCGKHLKVADRGAGMEVSCTRCGQRLVIPPPPAPAPPPAPVAARFPDRPADGPPVTALVEPDEDPSGALPAGSLGEAPAGPPPAGRRFPGWLLAVLIPAGAFLLLCGGVGVIFGVAFLKGVYHGVADERPSHAPPEERPSHPPRPDVPPPEPSKVVSLEKTHDLFNAYFNNEAAADLQYTGKVVEIHEVCAPLYDYTPRKDRSGSYYLDLNCGVGWVRVTFRGSEKEKLAEFSHMGGTRLSMRGKCLGLSGNVVHVSDGVLVSVEKNFKPEWRN